jgi:hypothetical protein
MAVNFHRGPLPIGNDRNFMRFLSNKSPFRNWLSCVQLLQQRLRLFQIARVEPFCKPPVHRSEQFARFLHLALVAPEACEPHSFVVLPNSPRK